VSENFLALGSFSLKICIVKLAFLTTVKPICSKSKKAVSAEISHMVVGDIVGGCTTNGFSQVHFSAAGGQICIIISKFNPHNSKPEVDIDFVLMTSNTLCLVIKYDVINFSQMVQQACMWHYFMGVHD